MLKFLSKQKKVFIKYAIILFFILSLVVLLLTSLLEYNSNESRKVELINSEQNLLKSENTIISNRINRISDDLMYLVDSYQLNYKEDGNYSAVENQWIAFSSRKMIYDQIRFIDIDGEETIRVNKEIDRAISIDKKEFQNKKDRYYFTDTIGLKENQIYISKLDLNIEDNEIEQPIKPMIRISTPYYANGELKRIIILNYSANDMLNQIKQIASTSNGNISMLNSDGYWLYNRDKEDKEWSFMYEDKSDINFAKEFPEEWERIQNEKDGYQINENGVFVNAIVTTDDVFTENNTNYSYVLGLGDWILISHMSPDSKNGMLFNQSFWLIALNTLKNDYYFFILILFISIIIAALIAINKNEKEKIKYFSEYDAMTGIYNRRIGLKKLSQLYKKSEGGSSENSICFIDINGLKEVNDSLGHEAGDELIQSVVDGIKKNTRDNDFMARLGGDEFLIVFQGIGENKSEEVWRRIVKEYDFINKTENRGYLISVSHGIESFRFNPSQDIDSIINTADEKMYQEKKCMKKDLKVLKTKE